MKKSILTAVNLLLTLSINSQNVNDLFKDGEKYIYVNNISHWVKIKGTANKTTPIFILHGGPGGNNYNFERTSGPLLEQFATIVYYEQRGCGRSEASKDTMAYTIEILIDDIDKLRIKLGLEKITLLGYSFGAELALRYAEKFSKNVENLILESPAEISDYSGMVQLEGFYSIAGSSMKKEIIKLMEKEMPVSKKNFAVWNMAPTELVDMFLFQNQVIAKKNRQLWNESNLKCPGRRHFQRVIFENAKNDLLEVVKGLDTKCLIISGIHDKNGGFHYGRDLSLILPNSELKLYMNSAHFPDMEEPYRFASDIKNFISYSKI